MYYGLILFLYIGFMVGTAVAGVGDTTKGGTIETWFPFMVFLMIAIPALLGYAWARDIRRDSGQSD